MVAASCVPTTTIETGSDAESLSVFVCPPPDVAAVTEPVEGASAATRAAIVTDA
jgi:hypothetical protein